LPFFVDSAPEPTGSRRATLTLYFNIDRDIPVRHIVFPDRWATDNDLRGYFHP
jgi:hypothetical protein